MSLLVALAAPVPAGASSVQAPAGPDPRVREAAARLAAGERDAAEAALAAFLGGRETDPAARHQAGVVWLVGGSPADAVAHFEAALIADPGFLDARLALGQALAQLGRVEDAVRELDAASEAAPDRYEGPYLAAAALDAADRVSEAAPRARTAARRAPANPGVRRFLGRILLRIEQWPEAEAELMAALRLGYREDPAIFADLGAALVGQEKLTAARAAYEQHLALAPDDPGTLLQLGYLDWRAGDAEASEERLNRAIFLDPDLRRAHLFLGLTALRRLDLDGAEAAFRRALERGEDFPEAWFHLGKIALRRGDPGTAAQMLEAAVRHDPDYREAYYQLAFALRRLGDGEGADRALARFEELDPGASPGKEEQP